MKKNNSALIIFAIVGSALAAYIANRITDLCLSIPGVPILNLSYALDSVWEEIRRNPIYINTTQNALIAAGVACLAVWLFVIYQIAGQGNYMHGIEHGSARWGTSRDSKYFKDKQFKNNIILTKTEYVSIQSNYVKIGLDVYDPNHNVLIVGGPGTGKSRRYLIPNLMQMHSSYVITDPKGIILHQTGKMLQDNGYKIRVFNLVNPEESDHYNPFHYLQNDQDILILVENLMRNTKDPDATAGDTFWIDQARGLYCALFAYLLHECSAADRTMSNVLKLLLLAEVREDNDDYVTPLDIMFMDLEQQKPQCFAVTQYKKFKQAKGRTAASILSTANGKLDRFALESIAVLTSTDDLDFDTLGDDPNHKQALFIITSDTNSSLNSLSAMLYQQLFDVLIRRADNVFDGTLPCPVRFLLDEFSNIGEIPDFDRKLATIRSRNISADIILQGFSQLKRMYKDNWEIIIGCCDSLLFLGSTEQFTTKYVSELIGKTTVDNKNMTESKGNNGSFSVQGQILGRELIMASELTRLHTEECILLFAHKMPFKSLKYDPKKHPYVKQTALYNNNNWFNLSDRHDPDSDADFDVEFLKSSE